MNFTQQALSVATNLLDTGDTHVTVGNSFIETFPDILERRAVRSCRMTDITVVISTLSQSGCMSAQ